MTEGFGHRRCLAPRHDASHAIRVPRVRISPSASFRSHLTMGTLAVRLGVPVIKASKGLAPSSHFPVGFRLPVDSARQGAARHAWRTSGRPGSLLTLAPHRSGRAGAAASGSSTDGFATRRRVPAGPGSQAMATAIPKACLARSVLSVVVTWRRDPPSVCWPSFPPPAATLPGPPSLHGVSWAQFPRFGGTMRHADSSPSIPPRVVACARRYHPSTCGFAPSDARCCVHGRGLGEPGPAPRRSVRWRRRGLPGSRETHPHACHALRPRRGRRLHGPLRCGEIAFRPTHDVGPHKQCMSGLNHAAYGLPVNASRQGSPQAHASLGSGWRPTVAGWEWIPTGCRTRFRRSHHGIVSPLTGLSRHTRCCTNHHGARTRPTDRICTGRCDTTRVGRGRSSDSRSHNRGRPHSLARLSSGCEDHLR